MMSENEELSQHKNDKIDVITNVTGLHTIIYRYTRAT